MWIPAHPYASASPLGKTRSSLPLSGGPWPGVDVLGPRSLARPPAMGRSEAEAKEVMEKDEGEKWMGPLQRVRVEREQARSPVNEKEKGKLSKIGSRAQAILSPPSRRAKTKAKTSKFGEDNGLQRTSFIGLAPARKTHPRVSCSPRALDSPSPRSPTSPLSQTTASSSPTAARAGRRCRPQASISPFRHARAPPRLRCQLRETRRSPPMPNFRADSATLVAAEEEDWMLSLDLALSVDTLVSRRRAAPRGASCPTSPFSDSLGQR